jgi:hypothetical protein
VDESHFPIISFLLLPLPSASRFFFPFLVFFVVAPPLLGFLLFNTGALRC